MVIEDQHDHPYSAMNERRLEEYPTRPIRIVGDFTNIENYNADFKTYIKNVLFPKLRDFFKIYLSVNDNPIIAPFSNTACDQNFILPEKYKTQPTDADLIIFFTTSNDEGSYLAYA